MLVAKIPVKHSFFEAWKINSKKVRKLSKKGLRVFGSNSRTPFTGGAEALVGSARRAEGYDPKRRGDDNIRGK
ncbi:MAG: hypothetical protein ABJH45_24670 [Paracoccaceae bacterium]